ncbi:MAG: carbohydrate ABC transporter permease [Clostridiales bacterium]|nr:carbohydrate ABC transporter permease [Clostridiales bacterium]
MDKKTKKRLTNGLLIAGNLVLAALLLFPIFYCLSMSLMTNQEIYAQKIFSFSFNIENYAKALKMAPLFRYILNTVIVAGVSVVLQMVTGTLAAFAFSMLRFRGRNVLFLLFLATMMIPGQAIIIANYLTVSSWNMANTYTALILPYACTAFAVFNLRQGFLSLPKELHEAAMIDGCTNFRYFYSIALPLLKPSLGALGIYEFLQVWNNYLWPLLITSKTEMRTVQIGLSMLQDGEAAQYGPVMAGAMLVLIPSIIVFLVGQKQMVAGLTSGAVKG